MAAGQPADMSNAAHVGIIGLGMIGGGIAQSLARHGRGLSVYDVRAETAAGFSGVAAVAASASAVARESDIVIIAVVNATQARQALAGPDGILAGAQGGLIVVLVSTVAVPVVHELAAMAAQHNVQLIDAGVTGGDKAATGGLVVLAGGDPAIFEKIKPVLNEFSTLAMHLGPLGAGMAAKIARNMITYGVWCIAHEAGRVAEAAGVDLGQLVQAVRNSDPQGAQATFWLATRGTTAPLPENDDAGRARAHYVAQLMHKDLQAALSLAADFGVTVPATAITAALGHQTLGLEKTV